MLTPATPGSHTVTNLPQAGVTDKHFIVNGKYTLAGKIGVDTTGDNTPDNFPIIFQNLDTKITWYGLDGVAGGGDDIVFKSGVVTTELQVNTGKTNATGDYSYINLPNGKYKIEYVATGIVGYNLTNDPDGVKDGPPSETTITNANITNANFVYEALGGFTGRITYDSNGNSVYDATDAGLNGVTVELFKWNGTTYVSTTKTTTTATMTGVEGAYKFDGIALGKYQVRTNLLAADYAPKYEVKEDAPATLDGYLTRELKATSETDWHIGFAGAAGKSADATFKSRKDTIFNGRFDYNAAAPTDLTKNDEGMAGLTVEYSTSTNPSIKGTFTTDASGNYTLKVLPYNTYNFVVTSAPTTVVGAYDSQQINTSTGTFSILLNATNLAANHPYVGYKANQTGTTYTLSGKTVLDTGTTANGFDASDAAYPGLTLQLLKEDGATFQAAGTTTSSATGDYSFAGLASGKYKVRVIGVNSSYIAAFNVSAVAPNFESTLTTLSANATLNMGFKGNPASSRVVDVLARYDNNGNKAYDSTTTIDSPAGSISIQLKSVSKSYDMTVSTNAGGTAQFAMVPFATDYTVTMTDTTNYSVVYQNSGATTANTMTAFGVAAVTGTETTDSPIFGVEKKTGPVADSAVIEGLVLIDTGLPTGSYDVNDTPVSGAKVQISYKSGSSYITFGSEKITLADGKYSFTGLNTTDIYRIDVIKTGTPLAQATIVYTKAGAATVDNYENKATTTTKDWHFGYKLLAASSTDLTITTLEDTNGNGNSASDPVLGTRVITLTVGSATNKYTSDGSGVLTLKGMPNATYTLNAVDTDNGTYKKAYVEGSPIALAFGYVGTPKVGFTKNTSGTATITGKVIFDTNNNGALDAGEPGIQGLLLNLYVQSGSLFVPALDSGVARTATTDTAGTYTFAGLKEAEVYQIQITNSASKTKLDNYKEKFGLASKFVSTNITSGAPASTVTLNMGYVGDTAGGKARNLEAQVRYDTNMNTLYDSSLTLDYPVKGKVITLSSASLGITGLVGTTDATGKAAFTNVPFAADYTVTSEIPANTSVVYNNQGAASVTLTNFKIEALASDVKKDIPYFGFKGTTLPSGGFTLSGEVVLKTAAGTTWNTGDGKIKDAKIILSYADSDGNFIPFTTKTTLADGKYSHAGLLAGTYRAEVVETTINGLTKANYNAAFNKGGGSPSTWAYSGTLAATSTDWHFGFAPASGKGKTVQIETYLDNGGTVGAWDPTDTAFGPFTITVSGKADNGLEFAVTGTSTVGGILAIANVPYNTTGYTLTNGGTTGYLNKYGTLLMKVDGTNPTTNPQFGYALNTSGVAKIQGKIFFDQNGDTNYNTGEGISGMNLELWVKNGTVYSKVDSTTYTTNPSSAIGAYEISGIADAKTYQLRITEQASKDKLVGYVEVKGLVSGDLYKSIDITTASNLATQDIGYKGNTATGKARDLTVYARQDTNGNEKYDTTDGKSQGVSIQVSSIKRGINLNTVSTSATGQVLFTALPYSDDYVIQASKVGWTPVYDNAHNPAAGASGQITFNLQDLAGSIVADTPFFGFKGSPTPGSDTLSGFVVANTGTNATGLDAGDTGLGAITLAVSYEETAGAYTFWKNVTTDGTGKYTVGNAKNSTKYRVQVTGGVPGGYAIAFNKGGATTTDNFFEGTLNGADADKWHFGYNKGTSSNTKSFTIYTWNAKPGVTETAYEAADTALAGIKIRIQGITKDGNTLDALYTSNGSGQIVLTDFPMSDATGYTISTTATDNGQYNFKYSSGTNAESFPVVVDSGSPAANTPYFGYVLKPIVGTQKITGTVMYQVGATPSTNDIPLVGATVYLDVQNASIPTQYDNQTSTTVLANGTYSFNGIGNANYQVRIESGDTQIPAGSLIAYTKVDDGAVATAWKTQVTLSGADRTADFGFKGAENPTKFKTITLKSFYDTVKNGTYDSSGDTTQKDIIITVKGTKLMTSGQDFDLGATGSYALANLPYDTYEMTSKNHAAKGLKVVYHKGANSNTSSTYSVTTDNNYAEANPEYFGYFADLTGSATISGRVVIDSDGGGTYTVPTATTVDDIGVNGAKVELYLVPGGTVADQLIDTQTTATLSSQVGFYEFTGLDLTKTYRVEVKNTIAPLTQYDPAFTKLTGAGANQIQENLAANVTNWHFGYQAKPGKSGTLKIQSRWDNGNTTYDAAVGTDTIRPNVTVTITGGVLANQSISTGATGEVEIKNLAIGSYSLSHTLDTNITVVYNNITGSNPSTTVSRTVANGATTTIPYGFKMNVYGSGSETIKGRVAVDSNSTAGVQADDLGMKDVVIKLSVQNNSIWQEVTGIPAGVLKTNANGEFTIGTLIPGDYKVEVVTPLTGYTITTVGPTNAPAGGNAQYSDTLGGGTTGDNWNFGYKAANSGSLSINTRLDENGDGSVTNTSGNDPMQKGIKITVQDSAGLIDTSFISDGTTKIYYNLPYGAYTLGVDLTGTPTGQKMQISYDPVNKPGTGNPVVFTSVTGASTAEYGLVGKVDSATGVAISGRVVLETEPLATATYSGAEAGYQNVKAVVFAKDTTTTGGWLQMRTTQVTPANGNYSFTGLPSSLEYKVEIQGASMALKYTKHGTAAGLVKAPTAVNQLTKVVNATADGADWIFAYGGDHEVKGIVSFDTDRTKVYKSGLDLPMDQVTVKISGTMGGVPYSTTTLTNGAGEYSFAGLDAGTWTVEIDPATGFLSGNYVGSVYDASYADTNGTIATGAVASYTVVTANGMDTRNRNFGFYGNGMIHGQSIVDLNGDGQYQANEANYPLAGLASYIKIDSATSSTFVPYYVKIQPDGSYDLKYLVPGFAYKVEAYIGTPPGTPQPFGVPANYSTLKYFASGDINGSGPITTKTLVSAYGVARTLPAANQPQFNMTTSYVAFSTSYNVSGRVAYDVNANNSFDATIDKGITGVNMKAYSASTNTTTTTSVDANGNYTFTGLAGDLAGDGIWEISIDSGLPAGLITSYESTENPLVADGVQTITLTADVTNVHFGYRGDNTVEGYIKSDDDNSGNDSVLDAGLAGVTVILKDSVGNPIATTTTDSTGKYSFAKLSKWNSGADYEVSIDFNQTSLAGYDWLFGGAVVSGKIYKQSITLADNNTHLVPVAFAFMAKSANSISGKVFLDSNDNKVSDAGEIGVGTDVKLYRVSDNTLLQTKSISLADGSYEFDPVAKAQYRIEVDPSPNLIYLESFDPDGIATPHLAIITVNNAMTNVNFGYLNSGRITIHVTEATGATYNAADPGIAGAEILLKDATGATLVRTGMTDGNGFYTFANLDATVDYTVVTQFGITTAGPGKVLAQSEWIDGGTLITGLSDDGEASILAPVSAPPHNVLPAITHFAFKTNNNPVTISKVALKDTAHIGEFVPYTVKIRNNSSTDSVINMSLSDMIPAGFKYVKGSGRLTVNGTITKIEPVGTRPIEFKGIDLTTSGEAKITYILVVGAGVTPGEYINKAQGKNAAGFTNSNISSATVKVTGDPLFDDSLIFGKVFWDKNRDGRQDKDEPGVGGVKLITARGEIITTDESGRYHLADVSGGRWERGTNFILKLDVRSLPQGLTTTTENPIVTRLSPGLPSRINFGVEVPPPVAARLSEQLALAKAEEVKKIEEKLLKEEKFVVESIHFAFDKEQIEAEFENTLDSLAEVLRLHPEWKIRIEGHTDSLGTEAYNKELSQRRANAVKAYLLKTGVNSSQLVDAVGLGLSEPVGDNGTPEGRYKNRRVEFKLEK